MPRVYRALYLPKGYACKVPYKASSSPPRSVRKPGRMVCLVATVPLNDWTSSRHDTGRHEAAKASTRLHAHASHFPLILTQEGGRAIHRHARWRGWSVALLGEGAGRPRPKLAQSTQACMHPSHASTSTVAKAHAREHPPHPPRTRNLRPLRCTIRATQGRVEQRVLLLVGRWRKAPLARRRSAAQRASSR